MTKLIVQGIFDLSKNQLTFNFDNVPQLLNNQTHSILSQQANYQGSWVPSTLQQPTFIQKHGLRLGSTALGLAGGVGLLVSCICSVLLPAIGSIGVISIAYLVNRKITLLHTKELSSEAVKSQSLFKQRIGSGSSSRSLLDEPAVDTGNLPPPILPNTDPVINQNKTNIPPPPPPPMPNSSNLTGESVALPEEEKSRKTDFTHTDLTQPVTSGKYNAAGLNDALCVAIQRGTKLKFNIENAERSMKESPEDYPLSLLLKELKTTYGRAMDISKSKNLKDLEKYFTDKVEKFENNFPVKEQIEEQTSQYMINICEKAKGLHSLLENMQWTKSLLCVLSERKDLAKKDRDYCSKKLKSIDERINDLQKNCNKKKLKETTSISTQDTSISNNPADILARRMALEYSDSSSSSENGNASDWED